MTVIWEKKYLELIPVFLLLEISLDDRVYNYSYNFITHNVKILDRKTHRCEMLEILNHCSWLEGHLFYIVTTSSDEKKLCVHLCVVKCVQPAFYSPLLYSRE